MPTTEPVIIPFEGDASDLVADAKKVESSLDKIASHTKTAGTTTSSAMKGASLSITDLRSAYMIAADAARVAGAVWKETGQKFVDYATEVKNMSRSLGASAEETSRLIQVADDVELSYSSLTVAMKEAQKDGVQPNIAGLAKLADQYVAIQDPAKKTKFLLDTFGKSGLEMGKLMEKGGEGIRSMSAAIDDSMIMTEDGIKAADDYKSAVDGLGDTWDAFTYSVAPPLVKATTTVIESWIFAATVLKKMKEGMSFKEASTFAIDEIDAAKAARSLAQETQGAAAGINEQSNAMDDAKSALKDYQTQLEAVSQANLDMESMSRTIASDQKQYAEDHAAAMAALAQATKEGSQEGIAEAQGKIQELEATWHESAQNMIYDMILVGLSAGGLLDSEQKALDEYAVKAGIKTQADIDEANRRREIADATIAGILQSEDVLAEQRKIDAETLRLQTDITSQEKLTAAANESQAIANVTAHTRQEITEQARLAAAAMRTAAAYHAIPNSGGGGGNYSGGTSGGGGAQRRDSGGAGIAGQPYMIGVKEVYIPKESGTFVPLGGASAKDLGGVVYNIVINNPVGQSAENDIRKALKMGSRIGRFA